MCTARFPFILLSSRDLLDDVSRQFLLPAFTRLGGFRELIEQDRAIMPENLIKDGKFRNSDLLFSSSVSISGVTVLFD